VRPPEDWRKARVTLAIGAAAVVAWLLCIVAQVVGISPLEAGFVPARLHDGTAQAAMLAVVTPLSAELVHLSFLQLAFNVAILLVCGRAVEPILGGRGIAILVVAGAFASAGAYFVLGPHEQAALTGSGGAVSAVIGAYALLFGRHRVKIANHRLASLVNALWLAAAWIVLQLLVGLVAGVNGRPAAIGAAVAGFLVGLLLKKPLLLLRWRGA
jgi:membrane associated rhomboid family serine protease